MRAAKHRYCSERARLGVTADILPHWAGNVVTYNGYYYYQYYRAWANWNVPYVNDDPDPGDMSAVWEGLGAGNDKFPLVQAGTEQDVQAYPPPGDFYYVWTENYPSQGSQWQFNVTCIDNIYAISWAPNCSFVQDNRYGVNTADVCEGPSADTTQAEWILEAPSLNGVEQPLADFQHVNFANTTDSAPGDADTQAHYGVWMQKNGVNCAYPGAWNNDAFQVTWESSYC